MPESSAGRKAEVRHGKVEKVCKTERGREGEGERERESERERERERGGGRVREVVVMVGEGVTSSRSLTAEPGDSNYQTETRGISSH